MFVTKNPTVRSNPERLQGFLKNKGIPWEIIAMDECVTNLTYRVCLKDATGDLHYVETPIRGLITIGDVQMFGLTLANFCREEIEKATGSKHIYCGRKR